MSTASEIWNIVLGQLSEKLTPTAMKTWFDDCEPIDIDNYRLVLRSGSDFKKQVITERFSDDIVASLCEIFSCETYELLVLGKDEGYAAADEKRGNGLPKKSGYTFDDFIVGNSNRFAHAAAIAVSEAPGKRYNPLFIYGDSGLGKTHLLLAIGHAVQAKYPRMNIAFVRGEGFTIELVKSIKEGTTEEFRNKFRKVDLLLVDDIQFIAGKQSTQNEFFHTFNDLYEAEQQIVICSDRPPIEMSLLDDRLRTRFEGGLMVDISPPDFEMRVAILRDKAARSGLVLSDESLSYISTKVKANVRQLEGVIWKLAAYKDIMGGQITREYIDQIIDEVSREDEAIPTPDVIIRETARYFSLNPEDILSTVQTKNISLARQISMYIMRHLTPMTFLDIGKVFKKDHSTVVSAVKKIEGLKESDPKIASIIRDIESNITNTGNKG